VAKNDLAERIVGAASNPKRRKKWIDRVKPDMLAELLKVRQKWVEGHIACPKLVLCRSIIKESGLDVSVDAVGRWLDDAQ